MTEILLFVLAFISGVLIGYLSRVFLARKGYGMKYIGTILVTKTLDKTVYTLELEGDPETLETQNEVIFRVSKMASQGNHPI